MIKKQALLKVADPIYQQGSNPTGDTEPFHIMAE
jgi:hypothetical protein